MPTHTKVDVAIVGAGMGSGVLALLAAARGRRVVVLDRHAGGPRDPVRGELLQPNGLRILDRLGLLDGLQDAEVSRTRRFHFHRIGGPRLVTIDYGLLDEPYNYTVIARPATVMAPLRQRLAQTPGIEMRWGCEVVGLVRAGGRVAGVEVVSDGVQRRIDAAVVVGGDGAASPVRAALGIRCRVHTYRDGYLTLILPRPPVRAGPCQQPPVRAGGLECRFARLPLHASGRPPRLARPRRHGSARAQRSPRSGPRRQPPALPPCDADAPARRRAHRQVRSTQRLRPAPGLSPRQSPWRPAFDARVPVWRWVRRRRQKEPVRRASGVSPSSRS